MDEKEILIKQLERQQEVIITLAKGLVKATVGILIAVTITAVVTIGSYFFSGDSAINIDNSNATQTGNNSNYNIGGEIND